MVTPRLDAFANELSPDTGEIREDDFVDFANTKQISPSRNQLDFEQAVAFFLENGDRFIRQLNEPDGADHSVSALLSTPPSSFGLTKATCCSDHS